MITPIILQTLVHAASDVVLHSTEEMRPGRVAIVMCDSRFNDSKGYVSQTRAINRMYAQRHGYKFVAFPTNKSFCPNEANPKLVVCKVKCLEHVMASLASTDLAMVVDSDAAFNDHSITVDQFLTHHNVTLSSPRTWAVFPTDCDNYYLNAGIMIWKNTPTTREFLRLWYDASKGLFHHPAEQGVIKSWILNNNTVGGHRVADHVERIPYGPETWHVGSCARGKYVPAKWITHVTGRWPNQRRKVFRTIMNKLYQVNPTFGNSLIRNFI